MLNGIFSISLLRYDREFQGVLVAVRNTLLPFVFGKVMKLCVIFYYYSSPLLPPCEDTEYS